MFVHDSDIFVPESVLDDWLSAWCPHVPTFPLIAVAGIQSGKPVWFGLSTLSTCLMFISDHMPITARPHTPCGVKLNSSVFFGTNGHHNLLKQLGEPRCAGKCQSFHTTNKEHLGWCASCRNVCFSLSCSGKLNGLSFTRVNIRGCWSQSSYLLFEGFL